MIKVLLDSKEIDYFLLADDGKIVESGDELPDTWEDTYVDVSTIEVGKKMKISYNFGIYTRKFPDRKPVWEELNYNIKSFEHLKKEIKNEG